MEQNKDIINQRKNTLQNQQEQEGQSNNQFPATLSTYFPNEFKILTEDSDRLIQYGKMVHIANVMQATQVSPNFKPTLIHPEELDNHDQIVLLFEGKILPLHQIYFGNGFPIYYSKGNNKLYYCKLGYDGTFETSPDLFFAKPIDDERKNNLIARLREEAVDDARIAEVRMLEEGMLDKFVKNYNKKLEDRELICQERYENEIRDGLAKLNPASQVQQPRARQTRACKDMCSIQ